MGLAPPPQTVQWLANPINTQLRNTAQRDVAWTGADLRVGREAQLGPPCQPNFGRTLKPNLAEEENWELD